MLSSSLPLSWSHFKYLRKDFRIRRDREKTQSFISFKKIKNKNGENAYFLPGGYFCKMKTLNSTYTILKC